MADVSVIRCFFLHKLILPRNPQMRRLFTDLFSLLKLT